MGLEGKRLQITHLWAQMSSATSKEGTVYGQWNIQKGAWQ